MSKKNKLKTRKVAHDCDVQREKAEKKKRDTKAAKGPTAADAGVKKATAKEQKSAIKRRRRALLKQGMKYEDILKQEETILTKDMDVDKE
eukprot:jgi/Ulvmu1/4757/UM020_0042.1